MPYRTAELRSARLVPPPVRSRRIAFAVAATLGGAALLALLAPWQQSVRGSGRVIAYAPLERQQAVEAPVSGRVVEWFVQEGSQVDEGDPVVRISDNDPSLMLRLDAQRQALNTQLENANARVSARRLQLDAVERAQQSGIRGYQAQVRGAERSLEAARQTEAASEAALETALLNHQRIKTLQEQGLSSDRQFELADLTLARRRTAREAARARAEAAGEGLSSKRADLERARADAASSIESARASLASAQSELASAQASIARLDVQISRQQAQLVLAPRAGTIFRVVANQGSEQVKAGDHLAILVPDTAERAVEVWVDGNDAALISPGRSVRLQFEGWPAVQFAGWPSVAVGTFGGTVAFVDSTDDGQGSFRVVIRPDPAEPGWPSARFLRQGVRTHGWVLLNQVSLGFEFWRQLNGFPPVLDSPPGYAPTKGPVKARGKGG